MGILLHVYGYVKKKKNSIHYMDSAVSSMVHCIMGILNSLNITEYKAKKEK